MPKQIRRLDLSAETLTELEARYKATGERRIAERILCVILKAKQRTHQEIADILLVSCDTISDWLRTYVTEGLDALCQLESGGSQPRLTEAQINQLQAELDQRFFHTAAEVADWVAHHFHVTYSERGMQALLNRMGFTFHKSRLVPTGADPQAQADFLKAIH